jgi:uncharacterized delta-60 repeat protein
MRRFPFSILALGISLAAASSAHAAQDGFLDPLFGQGGLQKVTFGENADPSAATAMAVLPDGRILLAGVVDPEDGVISRIALARLRADGQVDEGFGRPQYLPAGLKAVFVRDVAAQPDGKLVVVGEGHPLGQGQSALICRFLADGSVDTGFATIGNALAPGCRILEDGNDSTAIAVAIQRDGRIAVAGGIDSGGVSHGLVVRLDAGGNYDDDFAEGGIGILLPASTHDTQLADIAQTPAGDLVAVGNAFVNGDVSWQVFLLRGEDGGPDADFDGDGLRPIDIDQVAGGNDYAFATSVLPDGRIVIGGVAKGSQGYCPAVARLKPDGAFDNSLDGDGLHVDPFCTLAFDGVADMVVQSDGRIVLAGSDDEDFFAVRFAPAGGRDTGFGKNGLNFFNFASLTGGDGTDVAFRVANQAGRLVLAGYTTYVVDDVAHLGFAAARLDNDLIFADDLE